MRNLLSIARFELVRVFATARGLLFALAFALVWFFILRYVVAGASHYLSGGQIEAMLRQLFGSNAASNGNVWTVPELLIFWLIGLYLLPLFTLLIAADQTASDKARGTLRLLNLRASRDSIFFGRFLGQMLIQGLLVLLALASTLALAILRDGSLLHEGLRTSAFVLTNMLLVLLPYTALMALVSVVARSARQATLYAVLLWIVCSVVVAWLKSHWPELTLFDWLLPGAQIPALMLRQGWEAFELAGVPLVQAGFLLLIGRTVMQRAAL